MVIVPAKVVPGVLRDIAERGIGHVIIESAGFAENRILSSIRDTFLPKFLSGEIRVKDAEKIVGDAV